MSEGAARVVVTGLSWMGSGIGSIESAIVELFGEATNEITLAIYTIGTGADLIYQWLEGALARGIQVTLVVNHLEEQPQGVVTRLRLLTGQYLHFRVFDFLGQGESDLHAKAIVVDHRLALIGSSNISRRGLLTNHEIAVIVDGETAAEAGRAMDALIASSHVRRVQFTQ